MPTLLGQNQYGKAENRVVRVVRDGDTHHIRDLSVSVALSGDLDAVHHSGDNAHVL
ncbi:urate oxidase, partial [Streptomyces sp. NPDC048845]